MTKSKSLVRLFYYIKPLIPRRLQIFLRRKIACSIERNYSHVWPIDEKSSMPPREWSGWPDNKRFAFILTHDVDTLDGYKKCPELMSIEKELGFRSSFNFVPEKYDVSPDMRKLLESDGFEVGVHDLKHDGKLYNSRDIFLRRAMRINHYLKDWKSAGFRSGSMLCNMKWIHDLNIEYDSSTFDTDPFEPMSEGVGTIFPFCVSDTSSDSTYVEIPYTLPQDSTLFMIFQKKNIDIWKKKIDWIAEHGGMALLNTHPDYMNLRSSGSKFDEYPIRYYEELLEYIKNTYSGQYWHVLARDLARFWRELPAGKSDKKDTVRGEYSEHKRKPGRIKIS